MHKYLLPCLFLCLLMGLSACDGCRDNAGALISGQLPALPRVTLWETHLRAFSIAAAKPPKQPLRYRVRASCPLRYGFVWERRSTAAVKQRKKAPRKMAVLRVFGELAGRGGGGRWQLAPLWLRVQRKLPGSKGTSRASVASIGRALKAGPIVLQTEGLSWEERQAKAAGKGPQATAKGKKAHRLWEGTSGSLMLSRFWPELPKSVGGARKRCQKELLGWIFARS